MDPNSWTHLSTSISSSRRYQSRSDAFHLAEEIVGFESTLEYLCPFCAEDFDIVGLSVVILTKRVQRKRRFRRGGSNSTYSVLNKELQERNLDSLRGGSSFVGMSSVNTEPDSLLSSFMYNNVFDPLHDQTYSPTATMRVEESSNKDFLSRSEKQEVAKVFGEDQEENVRRSEFVQGLMMSSFPNDDL